MQDDESTVSASDLAERLNGRTIVLIGLMGAGKTSIGRRLAERLELEFADADAEIERAAGMSIPELFETHGEAYFRAGETKVIQRILEEGPQVLATGGGAFMNSETRKAIKKNGISIWLKADLELLWKRVRGRKHRPLLLAKNPKQVLTGLIEDRYPVYALADVTVNTRDVAHGQIVNDVAQAVSDYLQTNEKTI